MFLFFKFGQLPVHTQDSISAETLSLILDPNFMYHWIVVESSHGKTVTLHFPVTSESQN